MQTPLGRAFGGAGTSATAGGAAGAARLCGGIKMYPLLSNGFIANTANAASTAEAALGSLSPGGAACAEALSPGALSPEEPAPCSLAELPPFSLIG